MKKFAYILIASGILLLAAACNRAQAPQTSVQQNTSVNASVNQQVNKPSNDQKPADETANWRTYNNFGYQFKYPTAWHLLEYPKEQAVEVSPNDFGHVNYFYVGVDSRSLSKIEQEYSTRHDSTIVKKNVFVSGLKALEFSDSQNSDIYLSNQGKTYHIILLITENVPEAKQILSTLQLTK